MTFEVVTSRESSIMPVSRVIRARLQKDLAKPRLTIEVEGVEPTVVTGAGAVAAYESLRTQLHIIADREAGSIARHDAAVAACELIEAHAPSASIDDGRVVLSPEDATKLACIAHASAELDKALAERNGTPP